MTALHDLNTADGQRGFGLKRDAHLGPFGLVVMDLQHYPRTGAPVRGRVLSRGEATAPDAAAAERQLAHAQAEVQGQLQAQSLKRKRRVRARRKKGGGS